MEVKKMKRILLILVFLLLPTSLWAQVSFSISIGAPGFYLSVGNFFGYPEREVVVVRERGIPDDDLPVVFFISKHAHVAPEVIIKLRVVDGWAWSRICAYYRIPPTVFYIPVARYGPPYGRAYGHYKRYPHERDWGRIRLNDADIVNQVNLIFISKYYNYSPERVIKMREQGSSFGNIERKVYREREYQARGGVPTQRMRRPGSPSEMRRPQGRTEGIAGFPSKKDIPSQGVRPPHSRFQDVYSSIPHPSQRPEVKGRYGGEEKGRGRGQGKKEKRGRD
jgi:hypothetical protein